MTEIKAPAWRAAIREGLSGFEFARLAVAAPQLLMQPRGNGEPVMVLPGFAASDKSTVPLRGYLSLLGYQVQGWGLGRNGGRVGDYLPIVAAEVRRLYEQTGTPVAMIGWSLGGVIAREVARDHPQTVSQVVTLGSPLVGGAKYTSFGKEYERRGVNLDDMEARIAARELTPIRVPITSIYSKRDGIVGWQASIDRHNSHAEHIEVRATHLGLGISPDVFRIIARRLSGAASAGA